MANKNNPNRPQRSKSKAHPRTKPSAISKKHSKKTSTLNSTLSAKKARKLERNKAYSAQRLLEEIEAEGEDVVMAMREPVSRKKEKMLKNLEANRRVREEKEGVMDVDAIAEKVDEDL